MSSLAGLGLNLERLDQYNPDYKLDVGAVLRRGLSAWRAGFVPYGILAVLLQCPAVVFALVIQGSSRGQPVGMGMALAGMAVNLLNLMATMILVAAVTYGVFNHLRGQRVTLRALLSIGLMRAIPTFGVGLLTGLATLLGCCALVVPGLIVMVRYYVALPTVVIEETGALDTLRRSQWLTEGNRWAIFGIVLVVGAISLACIGVGTGCGVLLSSSAGLSGTPLLLAQSAITLGLATVQNIGAVMPAVIYHDLRVGREGANIDNLVKVFA
jgi:hypothetical protein